MMRYAMNHERRIETQEDRQVLRGPHVFR
jgi:hypothetical protein